VVEAPSTNLDELMFVHLAFVMQELQQQEEHLVVSRQTVFVFVLLSVFVHHLAQPEWLAVVMTRPILEHCIFKALPDLSP
jgi:hypothetical protein